MELLAIIVLVVTLIGAGLIARNERTWREKLFTFSIVVATVVAGLGFAWLISPTEGFMAECLVYTCVKVIK